MSGPTHGAPTPTVIVEAFATNGAKNSPIPVPDPGSSGTASFDQGFPALTMQPLASGGVPPSGKDMNGILFMISAYCAALQGGQLCYWDSDFSDFNSGYRVGALLASTGNNGFWFNLLDGNTNDPDSDSTGWLFFSPATGGVGYVSDAIPAGATDDWAPTDFGPSTAFLDIDTTAGAATLNGLVAGANGQRVTCTPTGVNPLTVPPNAGSSVAANRFRTVAGGITYAQNQSFVIEYSTGVSRWLLIP